MGIFDIIEQIQFNIELVLLGFRIVVLLFLVSWVRGHLGGGLVATVVVLILGWFILFQYFYIFGWLAVVYLILIVGGSGVIMDLAFGRHEYLGGGEMEGAPMLRPPG